MSHPPVKVSAEGVEAEPKRVGHHGIDLLLAISAIAISLISLVVAVKHGYSQERLVAANSWPFLGVVTRNSELGTGRPTITFSIQNAGVGPALLRDLQVRYEGRLVRNSAELLQACCGVAPGVDLSRRTAVQLPPVEAVKLEPLRTGSAVWVYKPGDLLNFFEYPREGADAATWSRLDAARNRITFQACYCSALGECFRSDLRSMDPEEVDDCPKPGPQTYID